MASAVARRAGRAIPGGALCPRSIHRVRGRTAHSRDEALGVRSGASAAPRRNAELARRTAAGPKTHPAVSRWWLLSAPAERVRAEKAHSTAPSMCGGLENENEWFCRHRCKCRFSASLRTNRARGSGSRAPTLPPKARRSRQIGTSLANAATNWHFKQNDQKWCPPARPHHSPSRGRNNAHREQARGTKAATTNVPAYSKKVKRAPRRKAAARPAAAAAREPRVPPSRRRHAAAFRLVLLVVREPRRRQSVHEVAQLA